MDVTGNASDFMVSPVDVPSVDAVQVGDGPAMPPVKKVLSDAKLNQLANARLKAAEARKLKAQMKKDEEFDAMFEARFHRFMGKYEAERAPPPPAPVAPPSHPNAPMSSFLSRSAF